MTTWDVLSIVWRRWYVAVLGLALTAGTMVLVRDEPGVYSSTVDAYLVAPRDKNVSEEVDFASRGLIALAGVVERRVNADSTVAQPVSSDVTITSMGIYQGSMIMLPNTGGQFVEQFSSPRLRVNASGPTAEVAAANRERAVALVDRTLLLLQVEEKVRTARQVGIDLVPNEPQVTYAEGRPSRALAALALLGLGLSLAGCVHFDRVAEWRRRRRAV